MRVNTIQTRLAPECEQRLRSAVRSSRPGELWPPLRLQAGSRRPRAPQFADQLVENLVLGGQVLLDLQRLV